MSYKYLKTSMPKIIKKHMPKKLSKIGLLQYFPVDLKDIVWSYCGDQFPIEKYDSDAVCHYLMNSVYNSDAEQDFVLTEYTLYRMCNLLYLYDTIKDLYQVYYFDFVWYITTLLSRKGIYDNMFPNYKKMNGLLLFIAKDLTANANSYIRKNRNRVPMRNLYLDICKYNKKYYLKYFNKELDFAREFYLFERELSTSIGNLSYGQLVDRVDFISDNFVAAQDRYDRFMRIYDLW